MDDVVTTPGPTSARASVDDALICALDPTGEIVAFNRVCERTTGYRAKEVLHRRVWDVLIPDRDRGDIKRVFAALCEGDSGATHVNDWITRDGARRSIAWSNTTVRDRSGAIQLVIAAGIDLTEARVTEASFRDREERLRAIVTTAVDGIVAIDRHGTIESFNPAAERIFGYAASEVVGGPVHVLMPSPWREEHQGYVESYLKTGRAKIIGIGREVQGRRKDGSTFPLDLAVSEVDHLMIFVGIVRDLTDHKRAEERLRQADRLASIGALSAGLGHDMNNVLLPMRGRLDALEAADLSLALRRHLRAIRDSVGYLQQLSDGLHLLALDPADRLASERSTEIAPWWHQVEPLLERSLPSHVTFTPSLPADLPAVSLEPHRLTQVVLNLLVNAGAAVGEGGRVGLSATRHDDTSIRLTVSDDGVGMTPEVRSRAFEPFFTTKDRGRGTGLGLSLVHGIVTSAGGSIDLQSEPGHGTTVTITLPVAPAPSVERGAPQAAPRVAVVSLEDERIATLIGAFLEDEGLRVVLHSTADPETSTLWVVSPADTDLGAVQEFLEAPGHMVVACGPAAGAWSRLGAVVIEDVMDFQLLRDRIGEALRRLDGPSG